MSIPKNFNFFEKSSFWGYPWDLYKSVVFLDTPSPYILLKWDPNILGKGICINFSHLLFSNHDTSALSAIQKTKYFNDIWNMNKRGIITFDLKDDPSGSYVLHSSHFSQSPLVALNVLREGDRHPILSLVQSVTNKAICELERLLL
jgi:hypothetical protein